MVSLVYCTTSGCRTICITVSIFKQPKIINAYDFRYIFVIYRSKFWFATLKTLGTEVQKKISTLISKRLFKLMINGGRVLQSILPSDIFMVRVNRRHWKLGWWRLKRRGNRRAMPPICTRFCAKFILIRVEISQSWTLSPRTFLSELQRNPVLS